MPERLSISINGRLVTVEAGSTVAAAMLTAGEPCRISTTGEPRAALCGMGVCFECRATVDGIAHRRTCQLLCSEDMRVETMR